LEIRFMRSVTRSNTGLKTIACAGLTTLAALLAGPAQAATIATYDDFSSLELNSARWTETEMWRYVDSTGRLIMGRNTTGSASINTGLTAENMSLSATASAPAKGLRATIKVTEISVPQGCSSNLTQTYAYSRARLMGTYFNIRSGGPVAGDRTGDVLAQIRVGRTSSTTDAAGVLRVQGVLSYCSSADCNQTTLMAGVQDLGTAMVGDTVKASIVWNKSTNTFTFTRDALLPAAVTYTAADSAPPSSPFNGVNVRNEVPNCMTGGAVKAGINATFDAIGIAQ